MHPSARRWRLSESDGGPRERKRGSRRARGQAAAVNLRPSFYPAVYEGSSRILSALLRSQPPGSAAHRLAYYLFDFGVVTEVEPFQTSARTTCLEIGWVA